MCCSRPFSSLQARLASAYSEYVPLHPAVSGPYLALLFTLQQLAAAAAGAAGAGGGAGGRAGAAGGGGGGGGLEWAPPGAAQAAAALLASPKVSGRIRLVAREARGVGLGPVALLHPY